MMGCHSPKCAGAMKIVFALLLLLNAFVWPKWLGIDGWVSWLAVLMVLFGLIHLFHPKCGPSICREAPVMAKKSPAKRRR